MADPRSFDLSGDGGVVKFITREGAGPSPQKGDEAQLVYSLYLNDADGALLDTSAGRPFAMPVGAKKVIRAWELAVVSMKAGECCTLTVKSKYGYGAEGSPPEIPGGATLFFEMELLSFGPRAVERNAEKERFEAEKERLAAMQAENADKEAAAAAAKKAVEDRKAAAEETRKKLAEKRGGGKKGGGGPKKK